MHKALKSLAMACLVAFPAICHASYPEVVTDPILRGVLDYLDAKLTNVTNQVTSLGGAISSTNTLLGIAHGGTNATSIAQAQGNLQVPSVTGAGASGTWSINITGNANTANTANTAGTATTAPNYVQKIGDSMSGNLDMAKNGILLTSADGHKYFLQVDDDGALTITPQ